jgi:hypothetical protein
MPILAGPDGPGSPSGAGGPGTSSETGTPIALSGNGETYGGGGLPYSLNYVVLDPAYVCGSTPVGYSGTLTVDAFFGTKGNTALWTPNACDPTRTETFLNATALANSGFTNVSKVEDYKIQNGQIYQWKPSVSLVDVPEVFFTQAVCFGTSSGGDADGDPLEIALQHHTDTGLDTYSITIAYWTTDPTTRLPVFGVNVGWVGFSGQLPASRADNAQGTTVTAPDFQLLIKSPQSGTTAAGSATVTLYGVTYTYNALTCHWR